ncbi:MAG: hypothetical protein II943_07780 [Victivallales bacterium]|nr:hypothetical protein [Victivallales bacterium]
MSITVSKKSIRRFLVLGSFSALLLICFACSYLESNFPLSYSNNCHEERLEGTWIQKNKDGEVDFYAVIRDKGTKYQVLILPANDNKEVEKSAFETYTFILTKLDSYYFISVKDDQNKGGDERPDWLIFRIQFKDNKLLVLELNEEGEKRAKEEDERAYRKISQRELQQWCVRNANLFTKEAFCFEREDGLFTINYRTE